VEAVCFVETVGGSKNVWGVKNSKMGIFVCAYINVGLRTNADWWGWVGASWWGIIIIIIHLYSRLEKVPL